MENPVTLNTFGLSKVIIPDLFQKYFLTSH